MERITKITRELSTFSRVEKNEMEPVQINEVIDAASTMAANEIRHRATLVKKLGKIPVIAADRGKLGQIFINLLVNASHSIEAGAADKNFITITTRFEDEKILIRIQDTGCGIPKENLERIFEPFFTTKSREVGTGLGLAITAEIVNKHGGEIHVTSKENIGTCFEIILPARKIAAQKVKPKTKTKTLPKPDGSGRVLVIDDEKLICLTYKAFLKKENEVVTAISGQEALALLEKDQDFDVIICDLMMPKMDGAEVFKKVCERWPDLTKKFIFSSGGAFTSQMKDFVDCIDSIVLEKPVDFDYLMEVVRTVAAGQKPEPRA